MHHYNWGQGKERCCMDRAKVELSHFPSDLRSDVRTADGVRPSCIQHAVEDGHADSRFSLLTREREAARSQARSDDGLVSAHGGFNQSALAVVGLLLPAQSSMCGNRKNVLVTLRRVVLGLDTQNRCHMRWDNHSDIFVVRGLSRSRKFGQWDKWKFYSPGA